MMDARRQELLTSLIHMDGNAMDIAAGLEDLPFDSDPEDAVELTRTNAAAVLGRFLANRLGAYDVVNWAKLIEGRMDIRYDHEDPRPVKELIFHLSNLERPEIFTMEDARGWIRRLGFALPPSLG